MGSKSKQGRNFQGILYPDSTAYDCQVALEKLSEVFPKHAYILHDQDINEDGTPKKPHYHWLGSRETPVAISTIAKQLGIAENAVEFCKSYRTFLRYLIHLDHPDKAQYKPDAVQGNFDKRFLVGMSEQSFISLVRQKIDSGEIATFRGLYIWAEQNDFWPEFRRNQALVREYLYVTVHEAERWNDSCGRAV